MPAPTGMDHMTRLRTDESMALASFSCRERQFTSSAPTGQVACNVRGVSKAGAENFLQKTGKKFEIQG